MGGQVADSVQEGSGPWRAHAGRVILFVHGYNDTLRAARAAYETFALRLVERVREAPVEVLGPNYRFYWPGDSSLGLISFISYPVEITDAKASAARLADFLGDLYSHPGFPARPLDIVAHSLGARVVLETLTALAETRVLDGVLKRVALMAPAVPVEHVAPGGPLYDGARLPDALTILTSEADRVLWLAFPPGDALGEGGSGRALGRYGPPPGLPARHEPVAGGVGHGDYWQAPESVARVIIEALGFTPLRREIPARWIPERETATPREIEGWGIEAP